MAGGNQVRWEGVGTWDKEEGMEGDGRGLGFLILVCSSGPPSSLASDHREPRGRAGVEKLAFTPPPSVITPPKPTGLANRPFTCLHPSYKVNRIELCPVSCPFLPPTLVPGSPLPAKSLLGESTGQSGHRKEASSQSPRRALGFPPELGLQVWPEGPAGPDWGTGEYSASLGCMPSLWEARGSKVLSHMGSLQETSGPFSVTYEEIEEL